MTTIIEAVSKVGLLESKSLEALGMLPDAVDPNLRHEAACLRSWAGQLWGYVYEGTNIGADHEDVLALATCVGEVIVRKAHLLLEGKSAEARVNDWLDDTLRRMSTLMVENYQAFAGLPLALREYYAVYTGGALKGMRMKYRLVQDNGVGGQYPVGRVAKPVGGDGFVVLSGQRLGFPLCHHLLMPAPPALKPFPVTGIVLTLFTTDDIHQRGQPLPDIRR